MSVCVQFNCLVRNETARTAMESYADILQEAFEHYRSLWDDYVKLQEEHEQCNTHLSSQVIEDKEIKYEQTTEKESNNHVVVQDSNISLSELDSLNVGSVNINFDVESSSPSSNKSPHKGTNSPPKSPVFCRTFMRNNSAFAKKVTRLSKTTSVHDKFMSDMGAHHCIKEIPARDRKMGISTSQHVETTFLPSGKRLKQSRLVFQPFKSNEKMAPSLNIDKDKPFDVLPNAGQDITRDIPAAKGSIRTECDATSTNENFEDVIEISPTQRDDIRSKVRNRLKLKRNISAAQTTESPNKNKCHSPNPTAIPEITIHDIDFALCPSPEYNSTEMKDDKSLIKNSNVAINILTEKVNTNFLTTKMCDKTDVQTIKLIEAEDEPIIKKENITQNVNDLVYEDETFYLPAEQIANRNNSDDFTLNDTENRPPAKKMLLDKVDVLSKRRDVSEHLNMRCKADRAKLDGWDCWECKEYYKNLSLPKGELQKRKNQCSRHRHKYGRPNTPEGFWDPEFPETLSSTYRQGKY